VRFDEVAQQKPDQMVKIYSAITKKREITVTLLNNITKYTSNWKNKRAIKYCPVQSIN
jgi:transcription elongation factor GreA-like protein